MEPWKEISMSPNLKVLGYNSVSVGATSIYLVHNAWRTTISKRFHGKYEVRTV